MISLEIWQKNQHFRPFLSRVDENHNVVSYLILPIKVTNHVI
jgi:hypothetical protein